MAMADELWRYLATVHERRSEAVQTLHNLAAALEAQATSQTPSARFAAPHRLLAFRSLTGIACDAASVWSPQQSDFYILALHALFPSWASKPRSHYEAVLATEGPICVPVEHVSDALKYLVRDELLSHRLSGRVKSATNDAAGGGMSVDLDWLITSKMEGAATTLDVLRRGKPLRIHAQLWPLVPPMPRWHAFDCSPEWVVIGGLVFTSLTAPLIEDASSGGLRSYVHDIFEREVGAKNGFSTDPKREVVVLLEVSARRGDIGTSPSCTRALTRTFPPHPNPGAQRRRRQPRVRHCGGLANARDVQRARGALARGALLCVAAGCRRERKLP